MLAVTLVPTLRSLLQQRGEAAALQAKVAEQRQSVERSTRRPRCGTTPPTSRCRRGNG